MIQLQYLHIKLSKTNKTKSTEKIELILLKKSLKNIYECVFKNSEKISRLHTYSER